MGPTILGGPIIFPFSQAREVLEFFVGFAATAPDELNLDCAIVAPPGAKPMVVLEVCYSGDLAKGEKVIAPMRSFRKPLADQVKADALRQAAVVGRRGQCRGPQLLHQERFRGAGRAGSAR